MYDPVQQPIGWHEASAKLQQYQQFMASHRVQNSPEIKHAQIADVSGMLRQFFADPARNMWVSFDDSRVCLTGDMMTAILEGKAELNWTNKEQKVYFKSGVQQDTHQPTHYADTGNPIRYPKFNSGPYADSDALDTLQLENELPTVWPWDDGTRRHGYFTAKYPALHQLSIEVERVCAQGKK